MNKGPNPFLIDGAFFIMKVQSGENIRGKKGFSAKSRKI